MKYNPYFQFPYAAIDIALDNKLTNMPFSVTAATNSFVPHFLRILNTIAVSVSATALCFSIAFANTTNS